MAAWGKWKMCLIDTPCDVMGMTTSLMVAEKYWNQVYVVVKRRCMVRGLLFEGWTPHSLLHLQIWRRDKKKVHSWTDLQRIKTEIVGAEAEGMELYPAESRVVNQAHVYHLWVVTGVRIPIGPKVRMVKGRAK